MNDALQALMRAYIKKFGYGAAAVVLLVVFLIIVIPAGFMGLTPAAKGANLNSAVPVDYREVLERAGRICPQITAPLLAAQVEAESGFNPTATSPAGAQGIAQFMPTTWATHGQDADGDGHADIFNPTDAIYSQGAYMCHLIEQITALKAGGQLGGDDVTLALAAYNAGLGNVLEYAGVPPFDETRAYVDRISRRAREFMGDGVFAVASGDVKEAIAWAASVASDPRSYYLWGGEGPFGYDCSGLTQAFMRLRGVELPHLADAQARLGTQISETQAQAGDLIFWSADGGASYYHTAIYIGNGHMISADDPARGINIEPIWGRGQHIIFRTY